MSNTTYYEILGITPALLSDSDAATTTALLKRAYRRSLLQNHPDKSLTPASSSTKPTHIYTIDEISTAFRHLSDPTLRAAYDKSLLVTNPSRLTRKGSFQTAEVLDLDDLEYDEATEEWFRGCRCGNDRGFSFGEADLEEAGDGGELLVGCADCSLWMKVHFAMVDDEED